MTAGTKPAAAASEHPKWSSTCAWIGKKLYLLQALPDLIEHSNSTVQQRLTIDGWLNSYGTTIKQTDTKCMLQRLDRLRHRRLRNIELGCRLAMLPLRTTVSRRRRSLSFIRRITRSSRFIGATI